MDCFSKLDYNGCVGICYDLFKFMLGMNDWGVWVEFC